MKLESKVTWLSVSLIICAAMVGGLGWYTWTLHQQMGRLNAGAAPLPGTTAAPNKRSRNFDPFADAWDPNGQFAQIQKHMDELMQQMMPGDPLFSQHGFGLSPSSPEVRLDEDSDGYTVVVKVPKGEDISLNTALDDNKLTISGEVKDTSDDNLSGNVIGHAQSISQFSQTITLAEPVDEAGMQVENKGKNIVIKIPKRLS